MFAKLTAFTALVLAASSAIAAPVELEKRATHKGDATWFEVGLGACGWTNSNSDYIVAMNSAQYKSGGNCGQYLTITNPDNGKTAVAQQVDECPTCAYGSIDMSPSLFAALASSGMDEGMFNVNWHYNKRT